MAAKINITPQAIAQEMGEKIKTSVIDGNNIQDILNIFLDIIGSYGIQLPEKLNQAIQAIQLKK